MGNLKLGDIIFDKDGKQTTVVFKSDIHHRDCYEVTFSDGSVLTADDEHQWLVYTESDRNSLTRRTEEYRKKRRENRQSRSTGKKPYLALSNSLREHQYLEPSKGRVVNTENLTAMMATTKRKIAVPVSGAIMSGIEISGLHPYVLGSWLGDGYTGRAALCTGYGDADETFENISSLISTKELKPQKTCRIIRFYGDVPERKYIPIEYLRSTYENRLELLKGLMDTDGHACDSGSVEFTTILPELADNFAELVRSLGWRCTVQVGEATLGGRFISKKYRIKFTPDEEVFKMKRKIARQKFGGIRTKWKYIVSIKPVQSVPTQCIQVDNKSSTYLAGKNFTVTHNTLLVCLWMLMQCRKYPGIRIGLGRKEGKRLRETTVVTLLREAHPIMGVEDDEYAYQDQKGVITYKNGSQIMLVDLAYQPSDPDYDTLGSLNFTHIVIEEVGEVRKKARDVLGSRKNRFKNAEYNIVGKSVFTQNPSQNFTREEFYDPFKKLGGGSHRAWPIGEVEISPGVMATAYRAFIRSLPTDNPFLPRNYIEVLKGLPTQERKRLFEGNWDYMDDSDGLFPALLIDRATAYNFPEDTNPKFIGVDVADGGKDNTVFTLVEGGVATIQRNVEIDKEGEKPLGHVYGMELVKFAQQHGFTQQMAKNIAIEGNGVGASIRDYMRSVGWYITIYTAGTGSRSAGFWKLHQNLENGTLQIHKDFDNSQNGEVRKQLAIHTYEMNDKLEPVVLSKKKIKAELGYSPDQADSLMIANWILSGGNLADDPTQDESRIVF